jgi:hypothetical protein
MLDKLSPNLHKVVLTFVVHGNSAAPALRIENTDRVQESMITIKAGTNDE